MHIFHGPTTLARRNQTSSRSGRTPTREREDTIFRSRETYPTCSIRILCCGLRLWLWPGQVVWHLRLIVDGGVRDGDIGDVGSGKTPTDLMDVESAVWLLCRVGVPCRSCPEVERLLWDVLIGHQGMVLRPGPAVQAAWADIRIWPAGELRSPALGHSANHLSLIYLRTISPYSVVLYLRPCLNSALTW